MRIVILYTAVCALLAGAWADSAGDGVDSLAYTVERDRLVAQGFVGEPYQAYLAAARELADEGYYGEAHDLLLALLEEGGDEEDPTWHEDSAWHSSIEPVVGGAALSSDSGGEVTAPSRRLRLRGEVGAAYSRFAAELDEEDSSLYSPVPADSVSSIPDDRPFEGFVRVNADLRDPLPLIERLSSSVSVSNSRTWAEATLRASSPAGVVGLDADVRGEKRMGESFGDSSDYVRIRMLGELATRAGAGPAYLSAPIGIEATYFRRQRPDYPTYRELSASPRAGLQSSDYAHGLEVGIDVSDRRHRTPYTDEDVVYYAPHLTAYAVGEVLSVSVDGRFSSERFPKRDLPRSRREAGGEFRIAVSPVSRLGIELEGRLRHESETRVNQDVVIVREVVFAVKDSATLQLRGTGGEISPTVRFMVSARTTIRLGYAFERFVYPLLEAYEGETLLWPESIADSYRAHEPLIALEITDRRLDLSMGCRYRIEDMATEAYLEDSRRTAFFFDCTVQPVELFRVNAYGDLGLRRYDRTDAENEEDVSLGISVEVRL